MKSNSIILFDDYEFNINNVKTSIGIDKFLSETTDKYELLFSIIVIINRYNYFIHNKIQSQTCFL